MHRSENSLRRDNIGRAVAVLRWLSALGFLAFGFFAVVNWTYPKWIVATLALYSVPLVAQFFRSSLARVSGLWFGAFLIVQTLISPLVTELQRDAPSSLVALQPNVLRQIDVVGDALPGIHGLQTFTTDSQGFRVTKAIDYESKPADTYRIFAIGASTTAQDFLDDRNTWTHLLQETLDANVSLNVEVIATGVSGVRAMHHLATLEHVLSLEPDMVLFLIGINDWNQHISTVHGAPPTPSTSIEFKHTLLGTAMERIYKRLQPKDSTIEVARGEYYSEQNDSLRRRADVRVFRPMTVSDDYETAVKGIGDACNAAPATCVFLTQPTGYHADATEELKRHFWMTPPNTPYTLDFESMIYIADLYNKFLLNFSQANGFASCNLAALMEPSTQNFHDDCHFNVAGARNVAAHLERCLLSMF